MTTVDPGFLVVSECMSLTSAMRKNFHFVNTGIAAILGSPDPYTEPLARRLGLHRAPGNGPGIFSNPSQESVVPEDQSVKKSSSSGSESDASAEADEGVAVLDVVQTAEDRLLLGLVILRSEAVTTGIQNLPALKVAYPFLEIVKSPLVSGYITSLALTSLEKFFSLNIIGPNSQEIGACLHEMAHALTHCRFEATDRREDDAVLLQLMILLDRVVSGPTGIQLSSKAVTEIAETCLSMACQMKNGDNLRLSVVSTLKSLMRTVFGNLKSSPQGTSEAAAKTLDMLVAVLDPASATTDDITRETVLKVLKSCFEVDGAGIGQHQELVTIINDRLWKYLAQHARNNSNASLVNEVLSLVSIIMSTCGSQFTLQFEFILVYLLTALTPLADLPREEAGIFYSGVPNRPACVKAPAVEPGSSQVGLPTAATQKSPEVREVMVEALARLAAAQPSFFTDLYVTYDCDVAQTDMCIDLLGFLCRNAYPDSARWSTPSVPPLCLEAVLSGLAAWTATVLRHQGENAKSSSFQSQLEQRGRKDIQRQVAEIFNNESPKAGIAAAVQHNLIPDDSPESIAKILRKSRRFNKSVVGKFLAKPDNNDVLECYIKGFDFSGQRIDEALREFLSTFRLPGESQQIEVIFDKFSQQYVEGKHNTDYVFSSDAAFVLAYAVIMLNTDQHSPSVKRRMDYDSFKRQVAKSNVTLEGKPENFDEEHTKQIYDAIHEREIVLPDEHDTDESFEHSWKENVLLPMDHSKAPSFINTNNDLGVISEVFCNVWRPIVSTLSFIFATATDDLVFSRVISGFHQVATLAARFGEQGALDHIVECLSRISTLASGDLGCPYSNIEIRIEGSDVSVMVSDLSVPFGSDIKAQMASITLFRILMTAQDALSPHSWKIFGKILSNLYIYGLGGPDSLPDVMPIKPCYTFERSKAGKSVGLFSALSSYLTSSADTPEEPSDDDVDAALGAADCIKACALNTVIAAITSDPRSALITGLLEAIPNPEEKLEKDGKVDATSEDHNATQEAEQKPASRKVKDTKKRASALPATQDFGPATSLLLHLAARAAGSDAELNQAVLQKARSVPGLIDVQLLTAQHVKNAEGISEVDSVLDSILVNSDSDQSLPVSTILRLEPSRKVWAILASDKTPLPPSVQEYLAKNLASYDLDNTRFLSKLIENNSDAVDVVADLCGIQKSEETLIKSLKHLAVSSSSSVARTREQALAALQRVLLSPAIHGLQWHTIVAQVLLPDVFEQLLKPDIYKRDPRGMDLTRQQAASLAGKVFLQFALNTDLTEDDTAAWIKVLKALDRLISSRRQPALQESIEEMLKNVILVMRMSDRGNKVFWDSTERELKGFLPDTVKLLRDPLPKESDIADNTRTEAVVEVASETAVKVADKTESQPEIEVKGIDEVD